MLYQKGSPVSLTPKQVETLVALVERRGEVISKAELMDRLWPGTAVAESNLSQNLYILRKTLGNREDGIPLIETFRRRGYRFNGELQPTGEMELLVATHTRQTVTEIESSEDIPSSSSSRSLLWAVACGASLILILAVAFAVMRSNRSEKGIAAETYAPVKMMRLTPDVFIGDLELTPDGRHLAFVLNEEPKSAIFLKDIATESVTQIMPPVDGGYGDLAFSPDGSQIYYTRFLKTAPNGTYFRVPVSGGEPIEVATGAVSRLTFSPDGSKIAFISLGSAETANLVVANADGSDLHTLLSGDAQTFFFNAWGSNLSWSPDGATIAVCGGIITDGKGHHKVLEVSVAEGNWRVVPSPDWNYVEDVEWLADKSGLIVIARETETAPFQIWRLAYGEGKARRLTNDFIAYDDLSLSRDRSVLVVRQDLSNMHVWVAPLSSPVQPRQLTFGSAAVDGYYGIDFTPDGKIVYTSARDGNVDLWMLDPNGDERQLTRNAGDYNAKPRVTPDGRHIVFVSTRSGSRQIWRMDMDGGNPSRLSNGGSGDLPALSSDGAYVYFANSVDRGVCLSRVSIAGGVPECLYRSDSNIFPSRLSPDDGMMILGIYDAESKRPYQNGVFSLTTLRMLRTLDEHIVAVDGWTPDARSFLAVSNRDRANIWSFDNDGDEHARLTDFTTGRIHDFAVSRDRKQIALVRGNPSAEAVLLKGF